MFDIHKRAWYQDSLRIAGINEEQLSTPVSTSAAITGLKKEYSNMLSIDDSIPFIAGAGDGCLANLGSNATRRGDMAVTIGTSGAARMINTEPKYDPKERIFNYILDDELYVTGGPINNGAVLLKWYAENFLHKKVDAVPPGRDEIGWFLEDAEKAPAGADGLIFLPYVQGERAPVWDASAKAVFFGIGPLHSQYHFMRAVVEGINYSLFQVAQSVQEVTGEAQHIYASGGFIHSKNWLQWMADVFGKEIEVANTADASSVGAAILALQATGNWKEEMSQKIFGNSNEMFSPRTKEHNVYRQYFSVYNSLYDQLKNSFAELYTIAH
jgi:gluconokinase